MEMNGGYVKINRAFLIDIAWALEGLTYYDENGSPYED